MGKYRLASLWAAMVVVLDQVTKLWVAATMELWTGFPVIQGFFNLVHITNRGAAWGFLASESIDWQRPLFIAVTILALGLIGYMLRTTPATDRWMITGLGLIAGGAVGNLIDRVRLGAVIDFLDFYHGSFHWPAFNVADCALTVGAGCIIVSMFFNRARAESG
ncbi:MAG: signal peptidase II [Pseudomonadota bacterium]